MEITQNIKNKKTYISIEDAVYTEKKMWFSAANFNGLFCMDIEAKKTECMGLFPEESYIGSRLYASMKLIKDKIYCIPFNAKSIVIYHIDKGSFETIKLELSNFMPNGKSTLFMATEQYKNFLFLFPVFCKVIICLELKSHKITFISDWVEKVEKDIFEASDAYFRRQVVRIKNKLFIPFCNANAVLELDANTLETTIHKLGKERRGYSGICYDGESFWLSSRNSNGITSWNLQRNEVTYYKSKVVEKNRYYMQIGISYFNEKVKVFPNYREVRSSIWDKNNVEMMNGKFCFVKEENNNILYFLEDTGVLVVYDKITNLEKRMEILIEKNNINIEDIFDSKEIILESKEFNLEDIITYLDYKK